MNKRLLSILVANLFIAAPALAADDFKIDGSVSVGGIATDDDNKADQARLYDLRDLRGGVLSNIDVKGRGNRYWFDLFGENLGRDDMSVGLRGGLDGVFKYRLSSDELRRVYLQNGRTPYLGAGTATQTAVAAFPILNEGLWQNVDAGYKRRDTQVGFEFSGFSPFYFKADGNRVTQSGTKIGASSQGLSPGNGYVEQIFPTEYSTRNASFEGGYSSKTMHFALQWMTSKFENDNEFIDWQNGFWAGTDRTYLGPDNKYTRLAGNATFRKLPLNSTLALRFTQDELKSDATLATSVLGAAGAILGTGPSVGTYNGRVENETFTVALASTPMKGLDTRLYWNQYERKDKSTHVVFNGLASSGVNYENELFSYDKTNWGFDAFFRLNRANRIGGGYDYVDMERERFDFDRTKDKRYFVEWKTSMLDNVSARIKYQNLDRKSNFLLANDGANANDVLYWNRFLQAYDAADLDQDSWKFTLDFTPVEFLDVSFEGTIKDNKYSKMVLGRLSDDRTEVYAAVSYGDPQALRFTVFADSERVKYEARHRVVGSATTAGAYDPNTPDTTTNYNWQGTNKDKNWAFGVTVDWPATPKLAVKASLVRYKTDGSLDFAAPSIISATTYPQPVTAYDDSTRTSFNVKGVYQVSKNWSVTGGYAYEKYEYRDAQFDGYRYVIPAANRADGYNLGYLANPNYKANILYGLVSYKF